MGSSPTKVRPAKSFTVKGTAVIGSQEDIRKNLTEKNSPQTPKLLFKSVKGYMAKQILYQANIHENSGTSIQLFSKNNKEYVIKKAFGDADGQKDFLNEQKILTLLSKTEIRSNYVIRLKESFEDNKYKYLVMKYCPNGSIADKINQNIISKIIPGFEEKEQVRICLQIAIGIRFLHKHNVVHRDLKTDNIMLDAKNNVKIIDFGIAALRGSKVDTTISAGNQLNPKEGLESEFSTDIFRLSCIIYEMSTGTLPDKEIEYYRRVQNISFLKDLYKACSSENSLMRASINEIVLVLHSYTGIFNVQYLTETRKNLMGAALSHKCEKSKGNMLLCYENCSKERPVIECNYKSCTKSITFPAIYIKCSECNFISLSLIHI